MCLSANMMSWMFILSLSFLYWSTTVFAHPGYGRLTNIEEQNGARHTLVNLAKAEDNDIVGKLNEEVPGMFVERHKRLSDQRRAELETIRRLKKMTEQLVTGSRGSRQLDVSKLGRRKRAVFEMNMKNLRKLFKLSGQLGYKGNAAFPVVS
ncbi:uncharacterized protein LOC116424801 [Nomia melanderi]|uniref:uncharacterized protein LOC116424801 n=1 Tax=Nomia melanderi TaxID=2448451 RepID=UPI00130451CB|nr:uncharacterized protein LOC116424801 [Nomia melanderi]